ncbi:MAG TPA: hypothetical protein VE465_03585 [Streptosporangiaceae bacterium]|jgi:DNA-directed RNA polymerase specialized sigma24 family protein|nr:hypothetical protein [Streptosporangiaceae bacterium]
MGVPHDHAWERRLHRRVRAGDEKTLAAAYDEFSPYVYGIALRATGAERVAEDVTEYVFLRLWERPGGLRQLAVALAVAGVTPEGPVSA